MNYRLFIAIPVPKNIQSKMHAVFLCGLQKYAKQIKIVPSQNLHITLLFLGPTPQNQIPELIRQLENLTQQPGFEIELESIGTFGRRILWLGIQNGLVQTKTLAQRLARALQVQTSFSGHVTLARNKKLSADKWNELVAELNRQPFHEKFGVTAVHLMRSIPTPTGSRYETIHEWKLNQATQQ